MSEGGEGAGRAGRPWTAAEYAYLRSNWRRRGDTAACARALGRSVDAVRKHLAAAGIEKARRRDARANVLASLGGEPRTRREVAELAGVSDDHAGEVLRVLRAFGLAQCRREAGGRWYWFRVEAHGGQRQ